MSLEIIQILVGPMHVFSYIIADSAAKEAIVIDPGADALQIYNKAKSREWKIREMIFTHAHADHVAAASALCNLSNAPCRLHALEMGMLRSQFNVDLMKSIGGAEPPEPSGFIEHDELINVGEYELKVIHLPGHSPGSVALLGYNNIFTGDVLFENGIGRVDLPGSNPDDMDRSLTQLLSLPSATRVYPGHAYGPSGHTTIGSERDNNPSIGPKHLRD